MEHFSIAHSLRRYRRAAGLTQQDLAERSGVSVSSISNLERGIWHDPRPETLELLLNALDLTALERRELLTAVREQYLASPPVSSTPMLPAPFIVIGRDLLLDQLREHLPQTSRVALHGLPGVGKTTVSLALVHDHLLQTLFVDGILWAGLGQTPNLLALFQRWGRLLGLTVAETQSIGDLVAWGARLRDTIGARQMLIVLDDVWNIEHAYACQVGGNNCRYVLTTRSPDIAVHFAGEAAFLVSELDETEGITLLRYFIPQVIDAELHEAAQIVQEVGGLPLALTLMGKFLQQQAYSRQVRRIKTALHRLHHGIERMRLTQPQSPNEAHPSLAWNTPFSLQASIGISAATLSLSARSMLYALGLFPPKPSTFSENVALSVSAGTAETLDDLVDAGLVEVVESERFQMHQTIVDYARLLIAPPDAEQRFIEWAVAWINTHQYDESSLEPELHLLLRALHVAAEGVHWELFLRGSIALSPYLISRGFYPITEHLLWQVQRRAEKHQHPGYLIETLFLLSTLAEKQGRYDDAEFMLQEGLQLGQMHHDALGLSKLLILLGVLHSHRGHLDQAQQVMQESLIQAREGGSGDLQARALSHLAAIAAERGQWEQAESYYHETLVLAESLALTRIQCAVWEGRAQIALRRSEYDRAQDALERSIPLARQCNYHELLGNSLTNLGVLHLDQGHFEQAEVTFTDAFSLAKSLGHREHMCRALMNLSEVRWRHGQLPEAEQTLEEARTLAFQLHHQHYICYCLRLAGALQLQRQEFAQALDTTTQGIRIAQNADYRWVLCALLGVKGDIHLAQQQELSAQESYEEMLSLAHLLQSAEFEAEALFGLARVDVKQGRIEQARNRGTQSKQLYTAHGLFQAGVIHAWLAMLSE